MPLLDVIGTDIKRRFNKPGNFYPFFQGIRSIYQDIISGFHYLLTATLASNTIHDAGAVGKIPVRLLQFEKLIQRDFKNFP